jgi:hypothetical protein
MRVNLRNGRVKGEGKWDRVGGPYVYIKKEATSPCAAQQRGPEATSADARA